MTVSTINSIAEFVTNGVTTNFPFFFKFLEGKDLVVTYINPAGLGVPLTLGTHYTVSGAGNEKGGSITTTAVLGGPGKLFVSRVMSVYQQTSLRNQGKFLAGTHEDVFDRLTMLIQQTDAIFSRTIRSTDYETLPQLPPAVVRANRVMSFDGAGNPSPSSLTLAQLEQQPALAMESAAAAQASAGAASASADRSGEQASRASNFAVDAEEAATLSVSSASIASAISKPFPSIALGIAATSGSGATNRYFSFPIAGDPLALSILYRNDAGTAIEIGRAPNTKAIESIVVDLSVIADRSSDWFYKGKKVMSGEADSSRGASIVTLEDGSVEIPKLVLAGSALELVQDRIDTAVAGASAWPTTALGALAEAVRRRVDLVQIGDSNQKKDGYGWGGGLQRALYDRFGCYATPVAAQTPLSLSGYTLTGEGTYGVGGGAVGTGAPAGVEAVFPSSVFEFPGGTFAGMGSAWLADGLTINNGANAGGVALAADHSLGVSNGLRAHYAWVGLASGAGQFQVRARINAAPWTTIASAPVTQTNTGEYSLHRQTLDIPAGVRTTGIECKWYLPGSSPLTGPFAAAWLRLENPAKHNGVSVSTFYAAGGQSLYDMANYLLTAPIQVLINWFGEARRLQLLEGLKPIVVIYINSGLNDQNETLTPSFGWRASLEPSSATAFTDNLEGIAKGLSDVWQKAGWNPEELFILVMPSHPVSTPDAAKLLSYRKAAFSFAQNRQRTSFIDLTLVTDADEILANNWYMGVGGSDRNHLLQEAYRILGARVVALIPELAV